MRIVLAATVVAKRFAAFMMVTIPQAGFDLSISRMDAN
jgi:hypothetical protein